MISISKIEALFKNVVDTPFVEYKKPNGVITKFVKFNADSTSHINKVPNVFTIHEGGDIDNIKEVGLCMQVHNYSTKKDMRVLNKGYILHAETIPTAGPGAYTPLEQRNAARRVEKKFQGYVDLLRGYYKLEGGE